MVQRLLEKTKRVSYLPTLAALWQPPLMRLHFINCTTSSGFSTHSNVSSASILPKPQAWGGKQPRAVNCLIDKVKKRLSYQENKTKNLPVVAKSNRQTKEQSAPGAALRAARHAPLHHNKSVARRLPNLGEKLDTQLFSRENKTTNKSRLPKTEKQSKPKLLAHHKAVHKAPYIAKKTPWGRGYTLKRIATCTIHSSRNNTLLSLMAAGGKILKKGWASAGSLGFKNSRKSTTYASRAAAKTMGQLAKQRGIKALYLRLQGTGRAKGAVVRTLRQCRLRVLGIRECTPRVHNGCRPPKKRRI